MLYLFFWPMLKGKVIDAAEIATAWWSVVKNLYRQLSCPSLLTTQIEVVLVQSMLLLLTYYFTSSSIVPSFFLLFLHLSIRLSSIGICSCPFRICYTTCSCWSTFHLHLWIVDRSNSATLMRGWHHPGSSVKGSFLGRAIANGQKCSRAASGQKSLQHALLHSSWWARRLLLICLRAGHAGQGRSCEFGRLHQTSPSMLHPALAQKNNSARL